MCGVVLWLIAINTNKMPITDWLIVWSFLLLSFSTEFNKDFNMGKQMYACKTVECDY